MPLTGFDSTKVRTPSCNIGQACEVCHRQFRSKENIARGFCVAPGAILQPMYTAQLSLEEASAKTDTFLHKIENSRKCLLIAIEVSDCQIHEEVGYS